MKKILILVTVFVVVFSAYGANISVVLDPSNSEYRVGEIVKIKWIYTGISDVAKVKIVLFRLRTNESTCIIAKNVDITDGARGYSWIVPSTCVNPYTNATENLVGGRFKIRVRWQGISPAVYANTASFKIVGGRLHPMLRVPVLGLNPAELAVFMHGPGPIIINAAHIRKALEDKNIKTPVIVELYRGRQLIKTIGKFSPAVRGKRVFFASIPERFETELTPEQKEMLIKKGNCRIVIKTPEGKIISEVEVPVKSIEKGIKGKPIRR